MEQFPTNTEKLLYSYWLIFIVIMFGNNPGMLSDQNGHLSLSSRVGVMVQYNLKLNNFLLHQNYGTTLLKIQQNVKMQKNDENSRKS